jgi:hypothetical protein
MYFTVTSPRIASMSVAAKKVPQILRFADEMKYGNLGISTIL